MHGRRQRACGGTLLAGLHDARKPATGELEAGGTAAEAVVVDCKYTENIGIGHTPAMIYCRSGRQKTEKRKTFSVIYNNFLNLTLNQ